MKNKIEHGIQEYDCDTLREEIAHAYEHENKSLRDIETLINTAFTRGALNQAGNPTDLPPETVYQTLTQSNNATDREQARLKTRLQQANVPVDELLTDYISFRTVKNYLNNTLDIDTSKQETLTFTTARETIRWSKSRCEGIIQTTLERLHNANLAPIPDTASVSVTIDARVTIEHDDKQHAETMSVTEYIDTAETTHENTPK